MKKIIICTALFIYSCSLQAAYVFRGTDNTPTNYYQPNVNDTGNPVGSYTLSNVPNIMSKLTINEDNTFDWYMHYNTVNLQTKGLWKSTDQNVISLTTNPYPENISFIYKGFPEYNNPNAPRFLQEGSIQINITSAVASQNKPLGNMKITCKGSIKTTIVVTDNNGWAICNGAGLPLSALEISAENLNLPNKSLFVRPDFKGNNWKFDFDFINASTDYAFVEEKMKVSNSTIEWNPISLKGNNIWKYVKENINR